MRLPPRPWLPPGLTWVIRLAAIEVRRRRRAAVLAVCAFAAVVPAAVIGLACLSAWRASDGLDASASAGGADLVAFLRDDLPSQNRDGLAATLGRLPGVGGVRVLRSDETLVRMRSALGNRAAILDGVEEGFLPATLEVSLKPGRQGTDRAEAIAARLARMEGITDVDILRAPPNHQLARAALAVRRLVQVGIAVGFVTTILSLGLAGAALRRRRADAHLMAGLGFSMGAVGLPGAITGSAYALAGTLLGSVLVAAGAYLCWPWLGLVVAPLSGSWHTGAFPGVRGGLAGVFAVAMLLGAALGWWGARPSLQEIDDLASTD